MRIAIYSHSIAPSIDGVCRRFTGILEELVRQRHEVILFTLEEQPEEIPNGLVDVISLDWMIAPAYPGKKIAKTCIRSLCKIYSAARLYRPDVIHATADGFSHSFALVGLLLKIPIVGSFHTDILDLLSTHNANFVQKLLVQSKEQLDNYVLDSCATTSHSFSKKLATQGLHCEHVIITAVNGEKFNPGQRKQSVREKLMFGNTDGFLCVYVGRISREKRIDVIVDAVRNLDNVYLAVIGNGPTASIYQAMHGVKNRLYCKPEFLSHDELAEIYASSDLHVSASEFETLGNTVLEAFACGIPVVVPRTQGFLDTVVHEENGFLFAPGSAVEASQYIKRLRDDRSLLYRMGANGAVAVADKTIARVTEDLLSWYAIGKQKQRNKSYLRCIGISLNLLWALPATIISLGVYEIVMAFLALLGFTADSGKIRVVKDFNDEKHKQIPGSPRKPTSSKPLSKHSTISVTGAETSISDLKEA